MSATPSERFYSISEAAAHSGLAASTLRYYESIGVIPEAQRTHGGYRVYTQDDLDLLTWVGCLTVTGMPVAQMREYVTNGAEGPSTAADQRRLLTRQDERLAHEQQAVELRRRYVQLKIAYWQAVERGESSEVERLSIQAAELGEELKNFESSLHEHP